MAYILWIDTLKYTYSPKILTPISDLFSGIVTKLTSTFRLNKKAESKEPKPQEQPRNPNTDKLEIADGSRYKENDEIEVNIQQEQLD